MENLPLYISVLFIAITALTLFFLWKAFHYSKLVLIVSLLWLGLQTVIGLSGFYESTDTMPPRFLLLVLPPVLLIAVLFITSRGRRFLNTANIQCLTSLHVVRLPVEITLLLLFINGQVPQLMTFEGRNFDIFSGLTAPLVVYFGYVQKKLSVPVLLLWNFVCLLLLVNVVTHAILAAPTPFQQLAFDQPNVAVLYFPFIWLPCFVVPAVLLAHLVSIRQLLRQKSRTYTSTLVANA